MAHATAEAAVGRHGTVSPYLNVKQHTSCSEALGVQHTRLGSYLNPEGTKRNHTSRGCSRLSAKATSWKDGPRHRLHFEELGLPFQQREIYGAWLQRGSIRCSAGAVSSGGSKDSRNEGFDDAAQQATEGQHAQGGGSQRDAPMILPLLLRDRKPEHYVKAAEGLLKMARLQNYFPSLVLVILGAWMASGRDTAVLLMPKVWITAVCSALIAVASMLANDVFDFRSGTDLANNRDTPLMTGEVAPDDAELAAGCLYGAAVIGICCLEPMTLRLLVGGAAVATYIYTPFLKRLLVVKNVIVAAIIASSILAGGLVAGGTAGVARTGQVSLFFFLCILCREILMDVGDMVGDKAVGVRTVAVCFGRRVGTAVAGMSLAAANAVLIRLLSKTQAVAAAGTLLLLPLHAKIFQIVRDQSDFTTERLSFLQGVVNQSMLYIGGTVILLATSL